MYVRLVFFFFLFVEFDCSSACTARHTILTIFSTCVHFYACIYKCVMYTAHTHTHSHHKIHAQNKLWPNTSENSKVNPEWFSIYLDGKCTHAVERARETTNYTAFALLAAFFLLIFGCRSCANGFSLFFLLLLLLLSISNPPFWSLSSSSDQTPDK